MLSQWQKIHRICQGSLGRSMKITKTVLGLGAQNTVVCAWSQVLGLNPKCPVNDALASVIRILLYIYLFFCYNLTSTGSEAFQQHWQVVGEDHGACPWEHQRGAVLCGRRDHGTAAPPSPGAAGALPEISHRVKKHFCFSVHRLHFCHSVILLLLPSVTKRNVCGPTWDLYVNQLCWSRCSTP